MVPVCSLLIGGHSDEGRSCSLLADGYLHTLQFRGHLSFQEQSSPPSDVHQPSRTAVCKDGRQSRCTSLDSTNHYQSTSPLRNQNPCSIHDMQTPTSSDGGLHFRRVEEELLGRGSHGDLLPSPEAEDRETGGQESPIN